MLKIKVKDGGRATTKIKGSRKACMANLVIMAGAMGGMAREVIGEEAPDGLRDAIKRHAIAAFTSMLETGSLDSAFQVIEKEVADLKKQREELKSEREDNEEW